MNWDDLSDTLKPICELEINLGNEVEGVHRDMWSNCPLSVVFKKPLHHDAIAKLGLSGVEYWENKDTHYSLESGYVCKTTRHSIAGPTA